MAKGVINEKGELVDDVTGQPIWTKHGNVTNVNSNESEYTYTLEDYGVREPDFPDEEPTHSEKDDDEDFAQAGNMAFSQSENVPVHESSSSEPKEHFDVQPTSFGGKKSKYEVTENSYFTVRFGLWEKEKGHFIPLREEAVEGIPDAEMHWVKFRMWTYGEELKWKSEFLEYNNATKSQFLNMEKLNERKIKFLMKDWSFGEYDNRLKLLHCDGRLSDESYALFYNMYPAIADTIVDMMNNVLENNQ